MKLFIFTALVIAGASFAGCPSETLVKKPGARTHYSTDLSKKFSQGDFETYGCSPKVSVMSREQALKLLELEYAARKAKI